VLLWTRRMQLQQPCRHFAQSFEKSLLSRHKNELLFFQKEIFFERIHWKCWLHLLYPSRKIFAGSLKKSSFKTRNKYEKKQTVYTKTVFIRFSFGTGKSFLTKLLKIFWQLTGNFSLRIQKSMRVSVSEIDKIFLKTFLRTHTTLYWKPYYHYFVKKYIKFSSMSQDKYEKVKLSKGYCFHQNTPVET